MANLATEMQGVAALVDAQVEAGASREEVVDALYRSWIDRFDTCTSKLSNDAPTQISMSIKDAPFSPDQRKQLARAVLFIGSAKERTMAKARANQKCHHVENFISEALWAKMSGTNQHQHKALLCGSDLWHDALNQP